MELVFKVFLSVGVFMLLVQLLRLVINFMQKQRYKRNKNIVLDSSPRYTYMVRLRQDHDYHRPVEKVILWHDTLNSKKQLVSANLLKRFQNKVLADTRDLDALERDIQTNRQSWKEYRQKMVHCPPFRSVDQVDDIAGISYDDYRAMEQHLCEAIALKPPVTQPDIRYVVTYTSPKGRNHYERERLIRYREIRDCRKQIEAEQEYQNSKQYQRKLMTDRMRYAILKRDGFRCSICGRTQDDGVKLHVDHIHPVSKGGKTEEYNLRTLCHTCNFGKSDQYDPVGLN